VEASRERSPLVVVLGGSEDESERHPRQRGRIGTEEEVEDEPFVYRHLVAEHRRVRHEAAVDTPAEPVDSAARPRPPEQRRRYLDVGQLGGET
jgi:hypothetical protein